MTIVHTLKHIDAYLLAAPAALFAFSGMACGALESNQNPIAKKIGGMGKHLCVALTVIVGVPLIVFLAVKVIFAMLLSFICCAALLEFSKFASHQFKWVKHFFSHATQHATHSERSMAQVSTMKDFKDTINRIIADVVNAGHTIHQQGFAAAIQAGILKVETDFDGIAEDIGGPGGEEEDADFGEHQRSHEQDHVTSIATEISRGQSSAAGDEKQGATTKTVTFAAGVNGDSASPAPVQAGVGGL